MAQHAADDVRPLRAAAVRAAEHRRRRGLREKERSRRGGDDREVGAAAEVQRPAKPLAAGNLEPATGPETAPIRERTSDRGRAGRSARAGERRAPRRRGARQLQARRHLPPARLLRTADRLRGRRDRAAAAMAACAALFRLVPARLRRSCSAVHRAERVGLAREHRRRTLCTVANPPPADDHREPLVRRRAVAVDHRAGRSDRRGVSSDVRRRRRAPLRHPPPMAPADRSGDGHHAAHPLSL